MLSERKVEGLKKSLKKVSFRFDDPLDLERGTEKKNPPFPFFFFPVSRLSRRASVPGAPSLEKKEKKKKKEDSPGLKPRLQPLDRRLPHTGQLLRFHQRLDLFDARHLDAQGPEAGRGFRGSAQLEAQVFLAFLAASGGVSLWKREKKRVGKSE